MKRKRFRGGDDDGGGGGGEKKHVSSDDGTGDSSLGPSNTVVLCPPMLVETLLQDVAEVEASSTPIVYDAERKISFLMDRDYELMEVDHNTSRPVPQTWGFNDQLNPDERSSIARSILIVPVEYQTPFMYLVICIKQGILAVSTAGTVFMISRFPYTFSPKCSCVDSQGRLIVINEYDRDMICLTITTKGTLITESMSIPSSVISIVDYALDRHDNIYIIYNDNNLGRIDAKTKQLTNLDHLFTVRTTIHRIMHIHPETLYVIGQSVVFQYHIETGHVCCFNVPW